MKYDIRAALLHLGTNMWCDAVPDSWNGGIPPAAVTASDRLKFDEGVWRQLTARMAEKGLNMLVVDLAEAVRYPSHPELAAKDAWSPDKMRDEVARLKAMGIEAVPKLNFSTGHDIWLGEVSRMVSTPRYYEVCADLIRDVAEIFGRPRLFHIGYDEETAEHQKKYQFVCMRQGALWWRDFLWFVKEVEKAGMRPWMWSDVAWRHDDFIPRCPKGVLQSNWYYGDVFDDAKLPDKLKVRLDTFDKLDRAGFDQVPCGSNLYVDVNLERLIADCRRRIDPERLKGFLMAPWLFTLPSSREKLLRCIDIAGAELAERA